MSGLKFCVWYFFCIIKLLMIRIMSCFILNSISRKKIRKVLESRWRLDAFRQKDWRKDNFLRTICIEQDEPSEVALPIYDAPTVSIVVPAYNQYALTMQCLRSIQKNTVGVKYEVILADDASTDETREIEQHVFGLRIIRSGGNLRFLRNCNNAARHARGEYIVFLNNDTQVQANWLKPMIDLLRGNSKIGLVGSMLLFPDMMLQDAGQKVLSNGATVTIGYRDPAPWKRCYGRIRDVDYVTGASIVLPTELWRQLGGFDEQFAPAYYEDADLAFRIREKGFRVVCCPASRVVHFSGASSGDELLSGQRSFILRNRELFMQKWMHDEVR